MFCEVAMENSPGRAWPVAASTARKVDGEATRSEPRISSCPRTGIFKSTRSITGDLHACTRCSWIPSLLLPSRMRSPSARKTGRGFWLITTPAGVPVVTMSPGSNVMKALT